MPHRIGTSRPMKKGNATEIALTRVSTKRTTSIENWKRVKLWRDQKLTCFVYSYFGYAFGTQIANT